MSEKEKFLNLLTQREKAFEQDKARAGAYDVAVHHLFLQITKWCWGTPVKTIEGRTTYDSPSGTYHLKAMTLVMNGPGVDTKVQLMPSSHGGAESPARVDVIGPQGCHLEWKSGQEWELVEPYATMRRRHFDQEALFELLQRVI